MIEKYGILKLILASYIAERLDAINEK